MRKPDEIRPNVEVSPRFVRFKCPREFIAVVLVNMIAMTASYYMSMKDKSLK